MVGDTLMRRLLFDVQERLTPEIERILLLFPSDLHGPENNVVTFEPFLRRHRHIAETEMKGVDAAYAVHHLIGVPGLRGLLESATQNPLLQPTANELPRNMRVLIRPKPNPGQTPGEDGSTLDRPPD
ncbi:hypothetical protein HFO98_20995 [Rhizobium leguminosarum]|uniref:hypothetical protein n=1 Tax=Rhizobium leguminosarum TaxID=384 RepID=UPI001C9436CF|nr:hypothetical protein [Rhizobium leguminosarum]MBY5410893.1 hypothetical protein [Rhizobium leguminosarum]